VVDALLQGTHGLLRLHSLGANDVGYFEVEGNVLTVAVELDLTLWWYGGRAEEGSSYRLLLVAFSICSSRAPLAPEDHQPIILEAFCKGRFECHGVSGCQGRCDRCMTGCWWTRGSQIGLSRGRGPGGLRLELLRTSSLWRAYRRGERWDGENIVDGKSK